MGLLDGVLPAVYSYGNTMQRKLKGLLDDPMGTIGLGAQRFGEDQQQLSDLAKDAGYMPGYRSVLATPQQTALARALLAQKATDAGGGMLGTFIGPGAKTWDALANSKAAQMEAAGVDPRAIWKDTMNWRGPDGKWRQEINDSGLSVKNVKDMPPNVKEWFDQIGPAEYPVGTIAQNVTHENLMRAYPELGDIGLTVTKSTGASYTPPTRNFRSRIELPAAGYAPVSITDDVVKSKAAHELQHAIQRSEGFATGGSPEAMIYSGAVGDKSTISNIQKQLEKLARKTVKQGYRTSADDALYLKLQDAKIAQRLDPEEAYKRLAGEAESRAVQARLNMTDAQRRAVFPADSYDRPLSQLIVRGWDGENLSTNALVKALKGAQ